MPLTPHAVPAGSPLNVPVSWGKVISRCGGGQSAVLRGRFFWLFQIGFWSLSALSLSAMVVTFFQIDHFSSIVTGRILTGFGLSCLLHAVYTRPFVESMGTAVRWMFLASLNVAAALLGATIWVVLIDLGVPELPAAFPFVSLLLARIYSLVCWNVAYFGVHFVIDFYIARIDASEAKLAARASELKQLQTQMNPHFLFNALNTIIASTEPSHRAREVTQNLADYLRFSLHEARSLEPLGRELAALEAYLELQRVRFQDGLDCSIEVSPAAMRVMVPPMLIQPLLENAFKYGPLSSRLPLRVRAKATLEDHWLVIVVCNTGAWVPSGNGNSLGSGLSNLRRRLSLLLGPEASLEVTPGPDEVSVTIRIPIDSAIPTVPQF